MAKKIKEKILKQKFRSISGNITILVLIMGLVVIVMSSSMVAYLYRDIGFTELDENKLKALNIAEAGISNMFLNIEKYNNFEISSLPVSPYIENIYIGEDIAGNYTVNHESYSVGGNYKIYGYSITSKGTDNSGQSRTVKVNLLTLNIYDFIYSESALSGAENIAGNTTIVGPFLVNGELDQTVGTAQFLEGPLFVKENIVIGGSASIGEADTPISLFLGGSMFNNNGNKIDPLNPSGTEYVYVSDLHDSDFNIKIPDIDNAYITFLENMGASIINGDLYIQNESIIVDGTILVNHDSLDYLNFKNGTLEIGGNIVIHGNIYIGEATGVKYSINYLGRANLVSTGDIYISSQLIPGSFTNFPEEDLLALISQQSIYLNLNGSLGGTGVENPNAAIMSLANLDTELENGVILRGGSISKSLYMNENASIYYEAGISEHLPDNVPIFGNILFTVDWQELIN